jgi:hypothetical protein
MTRSSGGLRPDDRSSVPCPRSRTTTRSTQFMTRSMSCSTSRTDMPDRLRRCSKRNELELLARTQAGGGLVQQQQSRPADQRARDFDQPGLPHRQARRGLMGKPSSSTISSARQAFAKVAPPRPVQSRTFRRSCRTASLRVGAERHVLEHRSLRHERTCWKVRDTPRSTRSEIRFGGGAPMRRTLPSDGAADPLQC